jgi:hypothetical protein
LDAAGIPMQNPPDIQPGDWVFGWVDNGVSAQVQIGDISGAIHLTENSIGGTISASWFGEDPVQVECLDWTNQTPNNNSYSDPILANGSSAYSCSWEENWDIQPGDTIGVGYFGPDGNWVSNAFTAPRLFAFPVVDQIFAYNWPVGSEVTLTFDKSQFTQLAIVGPAPWGDMNDIMAYFDFGADYDLVPGDTVKLSGSGMELTYTIQNIAVTSVNMESHTVSGTSDAGAKVYAWVHGIGNSMLEVDAADGTWLVDFTGVVDFVEGMCGRAEVREAGNSTAEDWCIP